MSEPKQYTKFERFQIGKGRRDHNEKLDAFFADLEQVCIKHSLSIAHEDNHGSFIFEPFCESNMTWLKHAQDGTQ